ncbi:hypothetical protein CS8_073270 [Cupriavidus sp. 8B]
MAHNPKLNNLKRDIDRVVGWLCPAARRLLEQCDTFDDAVGEMAAATVRATVGACFEFEEIRSL